jgi:hypothetical protein
VVGKEIAVKKYVVRLSADERAQLHELIRKGKRSAKARASPVGLACLPPVALPGVYRITSGS